MASEETIESVWLSSGDPTRMGLVFENPIVIIEEIPQFGDSRENFESIVEQLADAGAYVGMVEEYPAFISEPNTDPQQDNMGAVQFVPGDIDPVARDGVSVTIYGDDTNASVLIDIAETMQEG